LGKYHARGGVKNFCGVCGTPIFNVNEKYPGACMAYLGTLKDFSDINPKVNIWRGSKLGWVDEIASIQSLPLGIQRK